MHTAGGRVAKFYRYSKREGEREKERNIKKENASFLLDFICRVRTSQTSYPEPQQGEKRGEDIWSSRIDREREREPPNKLTLLLQITIQSERLHLGSYCLDDWDLYPTSEEKVEVSFQGVDRDVEW